MQDIDFDEIDRAVSSVTNPRSPRTKVDAPTVSDSPIVSIAAPSEPVVVQAPPAIPVSPAARRSGGRFMDVVHASSDMRPSPSRPQPTVIPTVHPAIVADVLPDVSEVAEPETKADDAFHWPDPIDTSTQFEEPKALAESEPPIVETPPPVELPEEPQGPLESPFLAHTKVEKRPLGAFSDSDSELLTPEDFPSSHNQTPDKTETNPEVEVPQNTEESVEVPAELHEDVLLLEAKAEDEPEEVPAAKSEEIPIGPTSITQQYKEQPSNTDDATGAIFDTEIYNQALVHAPRNNRLTKIIVWLVVLLLVGGGFGCLVYLFIKPILG